MTSPFSCPSCHEKYTSITNMKNHFYEAHKELNLRKVIIYFVVIMASNSIVFLFPRNNIETLIISLIILSIGFAFIFGMYWNGRRETNVKLAGSKLLYYFPVFPHSILETGEAREEKKSQIFSNIFGFLASLAITQVLSTYYDGYIKDLPLTFSSFVNITTLDLLPIFQLMIFFVVAIPLTHAGYIFLSNLFLTNVNENVKKNQSTGLIAIFIISIIQVSFLFFLANAVDNPLANPLDNAVANPLEIIVNQSNLFLFWLTLTLIMASVGAALVKRIINKNRIPLEWIFLYAFTVVFILTISLTILRSGSLEIQELNYFYFIFLIVLFARSVLDYYVGHYIYFPETKQ